MKPTLEQLRANRKDLVASECAAHADEQWILVTVDVEKAFLQGLSYEEIHKRTGEPLRQVYFILPTGSAALLRRVPGFEHYDERTMCLQCLSPGTGTGDAPRAFAMKLANVTRGPSCGYKPLTFDPQTEVRHEGTTLKGVMAKHVDDMKATGPRAEIDRMRRSIEAEFGKLDYKEGVFTCTGIRHTLAPTGDVTLDQDEYVESLKTITHAELVGKPAEEDTSEAVHYLFMSLSARWRTPSLPSRGAQCLR